MVPWALFTNPGALSTCLCHVAANASGAVLDVWGPIYYHEVLGLSPVAAGQHISLAQSAGLGSWQFLARS